MNETQNMQEIQAVMDGAEFVWPNYFGGATRSKAAPLIHSKLRELRLAVGGVEAKKQAGGPMFPVKSAKDLANKLAQALCDLDLIAPVVAQEITLVDTKDIPGNSTASGKPVFRTLAHVKATVRIGAADGSYVDVVGSGHGGDVDDKAGGKATTYAWKDAILKGLTTPERDMVDTDDEAPSADSEAPKPTAGAPRTRTSKAPGNSTVASSGANSANDNSPGGNYDKVVALIKTATSTEGLDKIAASIKANEPGYELHGADRLKATTVFVECKKALAAAGV